MAVKYIKPETKTIKIEVQPMMAGSEIPTQGNYGDGSGLTIGARGFSFEEEEEMSEE